MKLIWNNNKLYIDFKNDNKQKVKVTNQFLVLADLD